jgi:hypothetical protein
MAKNLLRVTVEGDPKDRGYVRLSDFLKQLDAVRKALRHTEELIRGEERNPVYYRIIDARQKSPLTVTLQAVADKSPNLPPKVVGKFLDSIKQIRQSGTIPKDFDYPTAEAYREIVTPQHNYVSSLVIANSRRRFAIDHKYEEGITKAIGPDEFTEGSITGMLDTLKLHNTTAFEVFPTIGPKRVVCHFPSHLKEKVKQALERYVCVFGTLRYKHWDKFPHAVDAVDLEIYPPENELPTLSDVRGMVPDLTDGLGEGEFLEKVRDDWKT